MNSDILKVYEKCRQPPSFLLNLTTLGLLRVLQIHQEHECVMKEFDRIRVENCTTKIDSRDD
jgi:hypothetical protein